MLKEINEIKGIHKNIPAIVSGLGPSLNNFKSKLIEFKDKGYKIFCVNDWYNFIDKVDYMVMSSPDDTIKHHICFLNQYKNSVIYADSVDLTDKNWIDKNILKDINIFMYDQRHFKQKRCKQLIQEIPYYGGFDPSEKCCINIKNRLTIQETLQEYSKYYTHYKTGDTCLLHAIASAVLMECNPIYIIGMDLDYKLGYAENKVHKSPYAVWPLNSFYFRILEDLDIINGSAKNLGIKLINLNQNSSFKNIELGYLPNE